MQTLIQDVRAGRLQNRGLKKQGGGGGQLKPRSSVHRFMDSLVTRARKFLQFIAVCIDGYAEAGVRADCRGLRNEIRQRQEAYTSNIFSYIVMKAQREIVQ